MKFPVKNEMIPNVATTKPITFKISPSLSVASPIYKWYLWAYNFLILHNSFHQYQSKDRSVFKPEYRVDSLLIDCTNALDVPAIVSDFLVRVTAV